MTARRLNVHGHCQHYDPQPGGKRDCLAGIDIRAHVGGPNFGWLARIPCPREPFNSSFDKRLEQVPCKLRELPTIEEMRADEAEMKRRLDVFFGGHCYECGSKLTKQEAPDVNLLACPNGCVSGRECKRIEETYR